MNQLLRGECAWVGELRVLFQVARTAYWKHLFGKQEIGVYTRLWFMAQHNRHISGVQQAGGILFGGQNIQLYIRVLGLQ